MWVIYIYINLTLIFFIIHINSRYFYYFLCGVNAAPGLSGGKVDALDNRDVAVDNLELGPGGLPGCFLFSVSLLIDSILFLALSSFLDCFSVIGCVRLSV